jgi:DNA polymerase III alpha subunit
MSDKILPIFKTHASIGRSLLTYEDEDEINPLSPVSVIAIAKLHKLDKVVIIDDLFTAFPELYKNCEKHNIQLIFGLNFNICNNVNIKDEDSLLSNCKISVLMKNSEAYKDLIKLNDAMKARKDNFYYTERGDWNILNEYLTDNLQVIIPPYDNFIHKNLLCMGNCIPKLDKFKPIFSLADMELPYDSLLRQATVEFAAKNKYETQEVHPIYYYKDEDFKTYMVFRAINNRAEFSCPDVEFLTSSRFSYESYENKLKNI